MYDGALELFTVYNVLSGNAVGSICVYVVTVDL